MSRGNQLITWALRPKSLFKSPNCKTVKKSLPCDILAALIKKICLTQA